MASLFSAQIKTAWWSAACPNCLRKVYACTSPNRLVLGKKVWPVQTRYAQYGRRSSYPPPYKGKGKKPPEEARGHKTAVRLMVCIAILGAAMLCKAFFPGGIQAAKAVLLPMMERELDYHAAITAIGETVAGEDKITSVLGDLYIRAFGGIQGPEEDIEVSDLIEAPTETPKDSEDRNVTDPWQAGGDLQAVSSPLLWDAKEEETEGEGEPEMAEEEHPAVAAFLEQQSAYTDYALPVSVTYERPNIEVEYTAPVSGPVSSTFGYRDHPLQEGVKFHYGTDVAVDTGTEIGAFAAGTVTEAAESDSWGLYMVIDHGGGVQTRYAHCSALYAESGDWVERGQRIVDAGATGNVTGAHLHFELQADGHYVNPQYYVSF